ncbi:MAG: cohesin domain-containing protein [Patescibacteria group bacterium]
MPTKTPYKISRILLGAFFAYIYFFVRVNYAEAASLYLSPSSGTYQVGQNFSVNVYVNSTDQAMNTVGASLRYSPDSLTVKSISTGGSFINLWIQKPVYNNSKGTINFEGGVFTPGYKGNGGKVATIIFQVKGTNNGVVDFTSAEILAADVGREASLFEDKLFLSINATDYQSGIDHFEIKEGNLPFVRSGSIYVLQDQTQKSVVIINAYDKSGNVRTLIIKPHTLSEKVRKSIIYTGIGLFLALIIAVAIIIVKKKRKHKSVV